MPHDSCWACGCRGVSHILPNTTVVVKDSMPASRIALRCRHDFSMSRHICTLQFTSWNRSNKG
ncbi:hypothetical protein BR93DRAFT_758770 [Coniochaeta sp. PMI_546]|nr:hypothetical protein BR93DRAFT_758770 [Coniochaeta sp. PMI_546]